MESFSDAALRHMRDAKLLERENCLENADHHYGLAAECAIKKVLVSLPGSSAFGELAKSHKAHINELWSKINHQSLQKSHPALLAVLKAPNPFSDWDVSQRYSADG